MSAHEPMSFEQQQAKWRQESVKFLREGLHTYNSAIDAWLNAGRKPSEEKPQAAFQLFTDFYKALFNTLPDPFNVAGLIRATESDSREEVFNFWKNNFTWALPMEPATLIHGIDDFIKYSRSWQNNYIKLCESCIDCLEKVSEAYKFDTDSGQQVKKAMEACMESCEEIMNLWGRLAQAQVNAFFNLSKTPGEPEKKKEIKPKTKKKVKKGKSL